MRQRPKVSTQMYFLSFVGIWLGSPRQSSQRLSNRFTVSANGILKWIPGSVIGWPFGSPKRVMTACSFSVRVYAPVIPMRATRIAKPVRT